MTRRNNPLPRFQRLLSRAKKTGLREPAAMILATADPQGRPSVRTVLLKEVDARGFAFYTNLRSRKGRELAANPRAALCFYWEPLEAQVIVEGGVKPISRREADAYWATRPRESQIAAWSSLQSKPLSRRTLLLARFARYARRFAGRPVPRPPDWAGLRVVPDRIEFWRRRPFRLHERQLYVRQGSRWKVRRLYP
ncbi:MAG: pyridoxamine 5'-phosphate oxidase [Candidatus Omnitrophica bacterium]|nr:pyridoxamine 5'-phosphate oxidase [Candidatus Omnitrophota bacterium]